LTAALAAEYGAVVTPPINPPHEDVVTIINSVKPNDEDTIWSWAVSYSDAEWLAEFKGESFDSTRLDLIYPTFAKTTIAPNIFNIYFFTSSRR
jgi:hypothetical protein